ncbi:DUF1738 domain-containing protein [Telmatocola sphagniphila]|uniref:DUF1738 domain-containing protein n=1 Tax=Telmatocola sphagniphila TaxID=1123043 RepID=A0A8E6B3R1_9BACT|nr:zincin-like metallopeptidase domain-containing protein [Telmatocola sphagniphila]QVL31635.1 DUF1738 domain-containing protein [Telmatocola sphagniphila]
MTTPNSKPDVYTRVTEKIVALLEAGTRPWHQPWKAKHADGPVCRPLRSNGQPYRGVNVLMLWIDAETKGFNSPWWMTFNQAKEMNAFVKKGEHGSTVVYASSFTKTEEDENGQELERDIPFLKSYTVFNAEQIEGLPEKFTKVEPNVLNIQERLENAEAFARGTGATIRHGGSQAYYRPSEDLVQMPNFETFEDRESYYSTLLHELTHWTKAESRLNRNFDSKRFGDTGYAREELIAEIGAAFLCSDLGITAEPREDHASYLACWLKVLKEDKKAIFNAAAQAEKAAAYLHELQKAKTEQLA